MVRITDFVDIDQLSTKLKAEQPEKVVIVSRGTCGIAKGAESLVKALSEELYNAGVADSVKLRVTGCLGYCDEEPIVIVRPGGFFYPQPKAEDAAEIIRKSVLGSEPVNRLLMKPARGKEPILTEDDVPFYKHQQRWLLDANLELEPTSIEDYIRNGGYRLNQSPQYNVAGRDHRNDYQVRPAWTRRCRFPGRRQVGLVP